MIRIFKLVTGEEIIGEIDDNLLTNTNYYRILNPMSILNVRDDYGYAGMRLRDIFIISSEEYFTVKADHVVSHYAPTDNMITYYQTTSHYSNTYTKPVIDEQIKSATAEMERNIEDEKDSLREYTEQLLRASGSTLQ